MKRVCRTVSISYDKSGNAAYIYLVPRIADGAAVTTCACESGNLEVMIHLDFDAEGRMLGIEVLDASSVLPKGILEQIKSAAEE